MDTAAFIRADSSNLPNVDTIMILEFMKSSDKHNIAEIRGVKALMSSRESYVESAVGYVELKRAGHRCDVRAKIVPEHKISSKYYVVTAHINNDIIVDTSCDGCAAACGGCKHTLVLLYWLQRRSNEPASTSVQCYWVKPNLKGAQQEVVLSKDIYKNKTQSIQIGPKDPSVLAKFRSEASKHACSKAMIMALDNDSDNRPEKLTSYCLFDIMVDFVSEEDSHSYEKFKAFCNTQVEICKEKICIETTGQVNSKLWHSMRQGRITGSKIHEVAHCTTPAGSLVQELLGGYKFQETKAMKRGKILEKRVIKKLEVELNQKITEPGFILIDGLFGASPDGLGNDFVVEIKCPISEKTQKNYINNGKISNKCMGQVQLEMLAAGKKQCLFCVADPKFEVNGQIEKIKVDFDQDYIEKLMSAAEEFWKTNIFPIVLNSAIAE